MLWTFRRLLFRLLLLRVRCRVLQSLPYHFLLSFSIVCYIIYSVVYQRTVNVITVIAVRHTAAIPQSNMWFPPFVSFFFYRAFCFPFLWLQYSTVIFAASLQRSLQFQKNKKKSLFLRFAQQNRLPFVQLYPFSCSYTIYNKKAVFSLILCKETAKNGVLSYSHSKTNKPKTAQKRSKKYFLKKSKSLQRTCKEHYVTM